MEEAVFSIHEKIGQIIRIKKTEKRKKVRIKERTSSRKEKQREQLYEREHLKKINLKDDGVVLRHLKY
jgi:ribosomal 50S subunit-recycling heat shock protein